MFRTPRPCTGFMRTLIFIDPDVLKSPFQAHFHNTSLLMPAQHRCRSDQTQHHPRTEYKITLNLPPTFHTWSAAFFAHIFESQAFGFRNLPACSTMCFPFDSLVQAHYCAPKQHMQMGSDDHAGHHMHHSIAGTNHQFSFTRPIPAFPP
jgi:hypothetical protein